MSNTRELLYKKDSREKLIKGVHKLTEAVGSTLGPKGRNVVIETRYEGPKVTKDGVSVAREVFLEDPSEDMGAQLVKEASLRTNEQVGDGTTTSTILAYYLAKYGSEILDENPKINPMSLNKGINLAKDSFLEFLSNESNPVNEDWDKIAQIATISANNDSEIGQLIADSFKQVGKNGVVTIERSDNIETYNELVSGIEYNKGYLSPRFITDKGKMRTEYEDAYVMIIDEKIRSAQSLLPILDLISRDDNRPVIIICEDIDPQPLKMLVSVKMRGQLNVVVTKAPSFGADRTEFLTDIATVTGGEIISENSEATLDNLGLDDLGRCEKVVVDANKTVISGGYGDLENIEYRAEQLTSLIESSEYPPQTEKLERRRSRLLGGVCVLYVGANTEVEMQEKKDRIEDALQATKAALAEGVLPGGGTSLLKFAKSEELNSMIDNEDNSDVLKGIELFRDSLAYPIRKILENAGLSLTEYSSIIKELIDSGDEPKLYNAHTMDFEDYEKTGVIDPKKVVRVSVESAVSAATMILTTDCVMYYSEQQEQQQQEMPFL